MKRVNRPNVLIIYTDQQRYDSLNCNGNDLAVTPFLDSLAKDGARFGNNFVQSPVCMPSRMSMLTSRYCSSIGIGSNGIAFDESTMVPVNKILKPYGYHTAQIGKLHFDPHSNRSHQNPTSTYGFDTFILSDEPGCYDDAYTKWVETIDANQLPMARTSLPPAAEFRGETSYSDVPRETHEPYEYAGDKDFTHSFFVASETCEFIKNHKDEKFFAIAGFYAPHTPINPPQEFIDKYNLDDMPLPIKDVDGYMMAILKDIDDEEWKKIYQYYMALVSHVDDCVGQIIRTLKDENIYDNTLVIFTSDHGEYLGDHGRIQKGMPAQDCISKVPLIISYPDVIKGDTAVEAITESVDIVPTILDFCSVQVPTYMQGKSLKKLLMGDIDEHRQSAFTENFETNKWKAASLRTKEYRYFMDDNGEEILFDLKADKDETQNVINDEKYKDVLSDMRKIMVQRMLESSYSRVDKGAEY